MPRSVDVIWIREGGRYVAWLFLGARRVRVEAGSRPALEARIRETAAGPARRAWTDAEREIVRAQYGTRPVAEIAAELGRSVRSVWCAACRLGLTKTRRNYGPELDDAIRARHAEGWSDVEIAAELGCCRKTVEARRRGLGLPAVCGGRGAVWSARQRERVRRKTQEQLAAAGLASLAELRSEAFRQRARAAGWPEDLRPREVQILNALWDHGPLTGRQLCEVIGVRWGGKRGRVNVATSLHSVTPGGTYTASLLRRGLIVALPRAARGSGRGRSVTVYSLPLWIERGEVAQTEEA